jgi:putative FmdB family regulatory protein
MPTYDYKCEKCGFKFEELQSITAEPLKECPKCKGEVKRLISGGMGMIFKGSGFYATDYKKACPSQEPSKKSGGCGGCPGTCGH